MVSKKGTWDNNIMLKIIRNSILSFIFLFVTSGVNAELTFDAGTFTATWREATINENDTPLTDLKSTLVYSKINGSPRVLVTEKLTSSPTGGELDNYTFTIPLPDTDEYDVVVVLTHKDFSGNESEEFEYDTVRVDKVSPVRPEGLI